MSISFFFKFKKIKETFLLLQVVSLTFFFVVTLFVFSVFADVPSPGGVCTYLYNGTYYSGVYQVYSTYYTDDSSYYTYFNRYVCGAEPPPQVGD